MDLITRDSGRGHSSKLLALPGLMVLTAVLGGCGSGSNNLADPTTTQTIASCTSSSSETCVTSQFIVDAPVVGLNYQCGIVNGVTDNTGTVSCYDNTTATFSIQGANNGKKIILGSYLIRANRDTSRTATSQLVSITPVDLVSAAATGSSLSDPAAVGASNIAQLLETLRSTSSPYNPDEPTSRLILDSKTLTAINLLSADITAADLTTGAYADLMKPVYANLKLTPTTTTEANNRLLQGLMALQAGTYTAPLYSLPLAGVNNYVGTLASSLFDPNSAALVTLNNVIDRSGHVIGQGVEWDGSAVSDTGGPTTTLNFLTKASAQYTKLILTGTTMPVTTPAVNIPSFINPLSNFVNSNFVWQPQAVKLNDAGVFVPQATTPLGNAIFTNGRLLGGTYVVGSSQLWQNATNNPATTVAPPAELATWSQTLNSALTYKGTLTLTKVRSVNTFLDPTVLKTAANVGTGKKAIFPLHAVLTFVKGTCTSDCTLGTQAITILDNGDIITDMAQKCLPVNKTTLISDDNTQQYRIGTLGAAFQGITNISDLFISPIIMLSGSQFGALDGIQIGTQFTTQALGYSAKMNVVGAINGSINISDNTTDSTSTGEQKTTPAKYVNFYDQWNNQKTVQTPADAIVTNRATGNVTAKLSSCYTPPVGM